MQEKGEKEESEYVPLPIHTSRLQGGPKKSHIFNTSYLWNRST